MNFSSNPRARHYKTMIMQQYAEPANFAGHYSLASWGCGINCQGMALIDRTTGTIVHYAPSLSHHDLDRQEENHLIAFGFETRENSNIIIANPECDTELLELNKTAFDPTGPRAYRWDGNHFELLCDLHYNEALTTCIP